MTKGEGPFFRTVRVSQLAIPIALERGGGRQRHWQLAVRTLHEVSLARLYSSGTAAAEHVDRIDTKSENPSASALGPMHQAIYIVEAFLVSAFLHGLLGLRLLRYGSNGSSKVANTTTIPLLLS